MNTRQTDMDTKIKEAKRAYYKKWRQSHPEKVKEYKDRYWAKKAAEMENAKMNNTNEIMQAQEYRPRRPAFDHMADAEPEFICPACGAPVYQGDRYFTDGCNVIACEHCPSELA